MTDLPSILRNEAEFWLEVPAGQPGQPGYQFLPLLFRLADAIDNATKEPGYCCPQCRAAERE